MKTLTSLIVAMKTSIAALILILSTNANAGLILDISSTDIKVGDSFSIDVIFDNPNLETLESFAFDFNDESLQNVNYTGDSLLNMDFASFGFGADIDKFVVAFDPLNSSRITLATLNFTALSVGNETLSLVGDDGFFTGLFLVNFGYESIASSISFNVTEVPEPSSLIVLIGGLALLIRNRRILEIRK